MKKSTILLAVLVALAVFVYSQSDQYCWSA